MPVIHTQWELATDDEVVVLGQVTHVVSPGTPLLVPGAHATHGPLLGPVKPIAHWQLVLPAVDVMLGGHGWQTPEPVLGFDVFIGHATHGPPLIVVYPGIQIHAVSSELPTREVEYGGHLLHSLAPITSV